MKLVAALGATCVLVALIAVYLYLAERVAPRARGRRGRVALLWGAPALAAVGAMLLYPLVATVALSFRDARSTVYVGLDNYRYVLANANLHVAFRNSLYWLVLFTLLVVGLGLAVAALADRVSYEKAAKAIVVMPIAISFVGAGVIWGFMYDYQPPGSPQTGTLNAIWMAAAADAEPIAWLTNRSTVNPALIFIAAWMFVGFAAVLLSGAIKNVPVEIVEAARIDGASELQTFWRVIVPNIMPTIGVVSTLMAITALKAFDIIYVLTNGNFGSEVLATAMYKEMFSARHFGRASAIAVVLLLATLPIILVNVRTSHRQQARA